MNNGTDIIEGYYRIHAPIYDITRWTFLFGRKDLLSQAFTIAKPNSILEIGCGTGINLSRLATMLPDSSLTGLDASRSMIDRCTNRMKDHRLRTSLLHHPYNKPVSLIPGRTNHQKFEMVLFSYSLSMMNPGWEQALEFASIDLRPDGLIAVVDFHDTPHEWFRSWMGFNHVRMEGHLLRSLNRSFSPIRTEIRKGYGGLWQFFLFIGTSPGTKIKSN